MKIDFDNYREILPKKDWNLIEALLIDLVNINTILEEHDKEDKILSIFWQEWHDEYSPERTDPCPDYYGCYQIGQDADFIGDKMTLEELENSIFVLSNFIENLYN